MLICCLRAAKYAINPFFGLGHLKTKTNRRVSHVALFLFPVLVYKCLVNNTALSDFQYCIQLMLKNKLTLKHTQTNLGTSITISTVYMYIITVAGTDRCKHKK